MRLLQRFLWLLAGKKIQESIAFVKAALDYTNQNSET
jgi:hypothetical protein